MILDTEQKNNTFAFYLPFLVSQSKWCFEAKLLLLIWIKPLLFKNVLYFTFKQNNLIF